MAHLPYGKSLLNIGIIKNKIKTYQSLYIQMIAPSHQSVTMGSDTLIARMLPLLNVLLEFFPWHFLQNLWHIIKCPVNDTYLYPLELIYFWKQPKVTQSNFGRMRCVNQME